MGIHKINKISLPYFDGKMYIQNNGYDGLSVSFAFN